MVMSLKHIFYLWLVAFMALSGCRYYRQDIIFRVDNEASQAYVKQAVAATKENYKLRISDIVEFSVFTNGGEMLIDPNQELARQLMSGGGGGGGGGMQQGQGGGGQGRTQPVYNILPNGTVYLPMLGYVKLEGLTLRQADSTLSGRYGAFYKDAFAATRVTNRRMFLFMAGGAGSLSSAGVTGRVITMVNEDMSLIEILAQSGSISPFTPMGRVRLIRGDLSNPVVHVFDLRYMSTIAQQSLQIQPNDIVYVEPGRRPFIDVLRDASFFLGSTTSILTLILILSRTNTI